MAVSAVEFLLQKLGTLLQEERSLLGGLCNDVDQIKSELEVVKSFLKYADTRQQSNEVVQAWVQQVRDVAYDIEDILDEFLFCVDRPHRGGVSGFLRNSIHQSKTISTRHSIATRLQRMKSKVHEISERRQRYGIDKIDEGVSSIDVGERWQRYKGPCASVDEENIVGIEKKKDVLVRWLTEDEPHRMVVSVVGIGGLGKTTLVSKVYNSPTVKNHFDYPAWISVSQSYQMEDLLRRAIKELFKVKEAVVPNDLGTMNYNELVEVLKNYLQEKRHLIILDDVWDEGIWSGLNDTFPDCKDGSRIIITSRNKNKVPQHGGLSRVYDLQPLEEKEEAWPLFCKKAFWDDPEHSCPQQIESCARKIVKKCEGLPLAIVAIGGLLSFRAKEAAEWEKVHKSLSWELNNTHMIESVKGILFLSYNNLPYHLKSCFLYCCIFPENFVINRGWLIRLWIAEGFVSERRGMTLEEVADDYLNELIFRSMLQVARIDGVSWNEECRMHDLMRDLALSTSAKEIFFSIHDGSEARQLGKARRLSILNSSDNNVYRTSMSQLRTFFLFNMVKIESSSLNSILSSFKLLRVLDLDGVSIDSVPKDLTNLFNLRYLNLSMTKIRELPKSLGRLRNLQTLDIGQTNIEKLPSGIVKLQNLRHLYMSGPIDKYGRIFHLRRGVKAPMRIWKLINLQTLATVEAEGEIVRDIGKLDQLRRVGITKVREVEGKELCSSIQKLNCLNSLFISARNEEESLKLESLSPPPPLLQRLSLIGHLEQAPLWFRSLSNLTHLYLHWSGLKEDPLSYLHALPNLGQLMLTNAYEGQQLWCQVGWFPRLKVLWLCDLKKLNEVRVEEGALPSIQEIYFRGCGELKVLPLGIEYLTTLQLLYLQEMPEELVQKLRGGNKSEYHLKVGHIPTIKII